MICLAYIPGRGPVKGLGYVVIAFSVPTHVEHLVLNMFAALPIQAIDLMLEPLPLSLLVFGIEFSVCIVGTVDQTEIDGCLNRKIQSARQLLSVDGGIDAHSALT